MITAKQLETLKSGNISVNAEKTKKRVTEAFKTALRQQREDILAMSEFTKVNNFYVVAKSGKTSPRTVIAIAQVLDISPYYLTGESDSPDPCAGDIEDYFDKFSIDNILDTEEIVVEISIKRVVITVILGLVVIGLTILAIILFGEWDNSSEKNQVEEKPDFITIQGITYPTDLKELDLANSNLFSEDIVDLKYMTDLTHLWLYKNKIIDISPLKSLKNLKHLDLLDNYISDLSPLNEMFSLTELWIGGNEIIDVSPLSGLINLKELFLWKNKIKNISPLSSLTGLTGLWLEDNEIAKELINELQSALPDCIISSDYNDE
jgi:hypothetical protein